MKNIYSIEKAVFIESYIECALWSSTYINNDNEHCSLDDGEHKLSLCTFAKLDKVASLFFDTNKTLILNFVDSINSTLNNAGHLFWLSTNGHGSGFFDSSDNGHAKQLQSLCDNIKPIDLYISDDGLIYA